MIGILKILALLLMGMGFTKLFHVQHINKYDGISMSEAEILRDKAQKKSTFSIALNNQVLHYLNVFLSRPAARLQMKACLKRMDSHKEIILAKLEKLGLPEELMAIPIIESGYQNIHSKGMGAGLWMLVEKTARARGLTINGITDERLNIERATEVALGYLKSNHQQLKNWQLAILAYNVGESKVRWTMLETNTKDPWPLIQNGLERDKGYLAKIMAAIIIMKNPDILN